MVFLQRAAALRMARPVVAAERTATGLRDRPGDPGRSVLRPQSIPQGRLDPARGPLLDAGVAQALLRQQGESEEGEQDGKLTGFVVHRAPLHSFIDPPP